MNNDATITDFDNLTFNHSLQMLKAALPYMDISHQKNFTICIKLLELRNALSILQPENNQLSACCEHTDENQMCQMLNHIRSYCTEKEKEWIDLFVNFSQAFQLYSSYKSTTTEGGNESPNLFELLKNMLTPEQQETFRNYSNIFSKESFT